MELAQLSTLIVEDDPVQQALVRNYVERTSLLKLVGVVPGVDQALRILRSERVGLLLLDIGLPKSSGFHLLGGLSHKPVVIVTTGEPRHALKGFELGVADMLVKPYSFARFLRAVQRALAVREMRADPGPGPGVDNAPSVVLQSGRRSVTVAMDDVLLMESAGNHVRVYLRNGERLIVNTTLEAMAKLLEGKQLLRVHRRFIVSCCAVEAVLDGKVRTPVGLVPIGKSYRQLVAKWLEECAESAVLR